ncbi:MAG TPA: hypothetical protein VJ780_00545, partial [Flavobacterium sp.]|nr:hypothetical protein [Flavobacterium sp.]
MNSNFSFKIYQSVKDLPSAWDNLAVNNIFLSLDYLKILETSAPDNMSCHFIALYQNQEIIAIAVSQFLDLSQIPSFGERDNCLRTKIRNLVFKNFGSKVLIIGNNMLTGQNGISFDSKTPTKIIFDLLKKATDSLEQNLKKQKKQPHLTIFKDYSEKEISYFDSEEFNSFYRFSTQPNMIFKIRDSWQHFDDYITDKNKKYRDQYKRARKKSDIITKRKLSLEDINNLNERIYYLYLNVAQKAAFNTFYLKK